MRRQPIARVAGLFVRLLTTGKVFPAPDVDKKLDIRYEGDPIVVEEPERRIRGKTTLKTILERERQSPYQQCGESEGSGIECRARKLYQQQHFDRPTLAEFLNDLRQTIPGSGENVAGIACPVASDVWTLSLGGYSQQGGTCVTQATLKYPWTTRYLTSALYHHTNCPQFVL